MSARRYVLVGSGVAAISAAQAIRSQDAQAEIHLLSDEREGYYSRPGLAYYLTGELNERQLFPFNEKDFQQLGVRRYYTRVLQINPSQHHVILHNQAALPYDRLLIATGARAARLQVPGSENQGIVQLDTLEDARALLKRASRARQAVVVGGGITALEMAEGLLARGVKTHYFLRGERYWSNVLDESESRAIEQHLQGHGLQIHYHTEIKDVNGKSGRVAAVRTQAGQTIPCDLLAVAIGILARKELAEAAGLRTERGILVNEHLQTSAPDIFAAGDVAQVFDPASGQSVLDSLWTPARQQGWHAGLNMAGASQPYHKPAPFNVTRLAGLPITIIGAVGRGQDQDLLGIARGDSEAWRLLPDAIAAQDSHAVNSLRVLVGQHTLLGALVIGDQTLSVPLQRLVTAQADITPIRQALLQPAAPVGKILAGFWTQNARQVDRSTR